jgi:hypothetical protein
LSRLLLSALVLLALLAGASSVVIFNYGRTTNLAAEDERVKNELSRKTQNLQTLEEEKRALQVELDLKGTGYNSEIVKLDLRIVGLQSEIENLQYRLKCQECVTVGLTFFWKRGLNVDLSTLTRVVEQMDEVIWGALCIRFFIYHAEARDFMPSAVDCSGGYAALDIAWANEAWAAYPERDIPIGVFRDVGPGVAGCAMVTGAGHAISIALEAYSAAVLSHELLHVFGFSEKELTMVKYGMVIPAEWSARIQARAKWFQMRPAP